MIKEFDRVVLIVSLPEKRLMKGDVGTVVMVYNNNEGYEVEFFTLDGNTFAVETLKASDIRPVKNNELPHVREVA
jgi:hypothetical protein